MRIFLVGNNNNTHEYKNICIHIHKKFIFNTDIVYAKISVEQINIDIIHTQAYVLLILLRHIVRQL